MRRRNVPLVSLAALILAATARAGGVRILDAGLGYPSYPTPQAAIDAAPDGAVLLVGAGNYGYVTISGKSISLFALPGATVNMLGVAISNLTSSQTVVVSGIHAQQGGGVPALTVANCAGWVRLESSSFHADDWDWGGCDFNGDVIHAGSPGAYVLSSPRVVFRACALTGGRGESTYGDSWLGPCVCGDGDGGAGLEVQGATTRVALFDCSLTGGGGGAAEWSCVDGGDGLKLASGAAFLSSCVLQGGAGGGNISDNPTCSGEGGDGCALVGALELRVLDTSAAGGPAGSPGFLCGSVSVPYSGGTPTIVPGSAARATFVQAVVSDLRNVPIAFHGGGSEDVVLALGMKSPPRLAFGIRGPVLVKDDPFVPLFELGGTDANGVLQTALAIPDLPAGSGFLRPYVQVLSSGIHGRTPGSAASLLLLDRDSGPDCDGDGLNDFVELIEIPSRDANHNLIPDTCPGG